MSWEDQEEKKKKKQGSNSSQMAFVFHVHWPEEQHLAALLDRAKYLNLWHKHWGEVAFMVEQPDFTTPPGVKDRYIEMVQSHRAIHAIKHGSSNHPWNPHSNQEVHAQTHTRKEWEVVGTKWKDSYGYSMHDGGCRQKGLAMHHSRVQQNSHRKIF